MYAIVRSEVWLYTVPPLIAIGSFRATRPLEHCVSVASQTLHVVASPPALHLLAGQRVHTPASLYAPGTQVVGALVGLVPGPVYVPYALVLVESEHAVAPWVLYFPFGQVSWLVPVGQ